MAVKLGETEGDTGGVLWRARAELVTNAFDAQRTFVTGIARTIVGAGVADLVRIVYDSTTPGLPVNVLRNAFQTGGTVLVPDITHRTGAAAGYARFVTRAARAATAAGDKASNARSGRPNKEHTKPQIRVILHLQKRDYGGLDSGKQTIVIG